MGQMREAGQAGWIDAHQICYNLLWRYPSLLQGLLTGDMPRRPRFSSGDPRLATVYYDAGVWPWVWQAIEEMKAIASSAGRPLSQLALRWILEGGFVASILTGSRSRAHFESNCAALDGVGEPGMLEGLKEASDTVHRHISRAGSIFKYYP
jgi:aryl-alcohol dehydrogenase-like predicted oxidoreductase